MNGTKNVVNVENCQFLKENCEFLSVIFLSVFISFLQRQPKFGGQPKHYLDLENEGKK